jgi:hypothetical protein
MDGRLFITLLLTGFEQKPRQQKARRREVGRGQEMLKMNRENSWASEEGEWQRAGDTDAD